MEVKATDLINKKGSYALVAKIEVETSACSDRSGKSPTVERGFLKGDHHDSTLIMEAS